MILECMLALLLRHPDSIGQVVTVRDIYHTSSTDHCIETTKRLGASWFSDEILSEIELPIEECL